MSQKGLFAAGTEFGVRQTRAGKASTMAIGVLSTSSLRYSALYNVPGKYTSHGHASLHCDGPLVLRRLLSDVSVESLAGVNSGT